MSQLDVLRQVADYGVQAGFWAAVAFPIATALVWRWWKSWWGWAIVSLDLALALALIGPILIIEFGMVPGSTPGHVFSWIEAIALCLIPVIIVWRGVLVLITQRRGEEEDERRE